VLSDEVRTAEIGQNETVTVSIELPKSGRSKRALLMPPAPTHSASHSWNAFGRHAINPARRRHRSGNR